MWVSDVGRKRKLRNMLLVIFTIQIALIIRIGFIQFVQGAELQAMAYSQQTLNRAINAKRGRILDRTGTVELAVSASTETVSVNPMNVPNEKKEKLAQAMADIFTLDYDKTFVTFWYQRHEDDKIVIERIHAYEFISRLIIHIPEENFKYIRWC